MLKLKAVVHFCNYQEWQQNIRRKHEKKLKHCSVKINSIENTTVMWELTETMSYILKNAD